MNKLEHLLEYESFNAVNEAGIPVYDEEKFEASPNASPDDEVSINQLIPKIKELLDGVQNGELKEVYVIADVPVRGPNAPTYLRDILAKETERRERRTTILYGSRIEKADRPEDDTTDDINIDIPSQFVIHDITIEDGKEYLLGIPEKFEYLTQREPSKYNYYLTKILPSNVDEVYFVK